jgi:hypothetical protein
MGKVNASKVNGTKVDIGKKSSLDGEEEEHGSKSMFSSMPPVVATNLESYVQNPGNGKDRAGGELNGCIMHQIHTSI